MSETPPSVPACRPRQSATMRRSAFSVRRGPGTAPEDHLPQIIHNLWITGAQWCDFLSFDDRFEPQMQTFLVRVTRSDVDIAAYEAAALKFLAEVETEVNAIRTTTKGWAA